MTQPILFLDIDGVLNSERFFEKQRGRGVTIFHDNADLFDPDAVALLNRIVTATNCLVVVSSSWRQYWSLESILGWMRGAGYTGTLHDKTPTVGPRFERADEVAEWLCTNGLTLEHPHVAIDDTFGPPGDVRLVATTYAEGLTAANAAEAVHLLLNDDRHISGRRQP